MTSTLLPWTAEEIEHRIRAIVRDGTESFKIDLKRELDLSDKAHQVELVLDVLSIANTDDTAFDSYGFLIYGADRSARAVVGGVDLLAREKVDHTANTISQRLANFVSPVPRFQLVEFLDPSVGPWGVLVIRPSDEQPHILVRESGQAKVGQWWVRMNEHKALASSADYVRVLGKVARRAAEPFERRLVDLATSLGALESRVSTLATISVSASAAPSTQEADARSVIRAALHDPRTSVEDALVGEAVRLASLLETGTDVLTWHHRTRDAAEAEKVLRHVEELTHPLADALVAVAQLDRTGAHAEAVALALRQIGRVQTPMNVGRSEEGEALRSYPLALCTAALTITAVAHRRSWLLETLRTTEYRRARFSDEIHTPVRSLWEVRSGEMAFQLLRPRNVVPVAERMRDVVLSWTLTALRGEPAGLLWFHAEFLLALFSLMPGARGFPIAGVYLYEREGQAAIADLLSIDTDWIEEGLGPLPPLLERFDATAAEMIDSRTIARGFDTKTREVFERARARRDRA